MKSAGLGISHSIEVFYDKEIKGSYTEAINLRLFLLKGLRKYLMHRLKEHYKTKSHYGVEC